MLSVKVHFYKFCIGRAGYFVQSKACIEAAHGFKQSLQAVTVTAGFLSCSYARNAHVGKYFGVERLAVVVYPYERRVTLGAAYNNFDLAAVAYFGGGLSPK